MATDEDERRYTMEDPHPADEDLSPKVKEFIYGKPDELPELPDPADNGKDPFIHGGRVGEGDESPSDEGESAVATYEGEHHPAVEEFIHGKPTELPELGPDDFGVDRPDPLFDGERIHLQSDEE